MWLVKIIVIDHNHFLQLKLDYQKSSLEIRLPSVVTRCRKKFRNQLRLSIQRLLHYSFGAAFSLVRWSTNAVLLSDYTLLRSSHQYLRNMCNIIQL